MHLGPACVGVFAVGSHSSLLLHALVSPSLSMLVRSCAWLICRMPVMLCMNRLDRLGIDLELWRLMLRSFGFCDDI